jgi:hypothetical protein
LQGRNSAVLISLVFVISLFLLQPLASQAGFATSTSGTYAPSAPTGVALSMTSATGSAPSTFSANVAHIGTLAMASAKPTMSFGVVDASASYGIPSYKNAAAQQADLSMLTSTGAQCIRLDIDYAPWLPGGNASLIQLLTSVAKDVRSQGRCLIIADASSESYRNGGCLDWAQFKVAWVQRVSTFATLFHPKYYIVVKEPGWYVPMVCDAATNPLFQSVNDWIGLTQNLTNAVKAVSPSTQVGVAVSAGYTTTSPAFYIQYLNEAQQLSGISFVGFDIYTNSDQISVEHFLYSYPPSKPIWIAEAWSNTAATTQAQAQSDAQWMKAFYSYAQSIKAKMLIPFYTDLFSGYTVPTTSSALINFYHGRTPVYTEFHNVVAGHP